MSDSLLPVILCGGSGTRLWPLSRESYPKQFHRFVGNHTLFEDTILRAAALPQCQEIVIVCNEAHRFMAAEQAARVFRGRVHTVLEPAARNTAAAIAAAAQLFPDRTLVVMPSDHYMASPAPFVDCVTKAIPAAKAHYLVTFGISPTAPETGYGYIAAGEAINGLTDVWRVKSFLEKPNLELAKSLLATPGHTWNSGMFVMQAADFLQELAAFAPQVHAAVQAATQNARHETDFVRLDAAAFEGSPSISVDYAVFEHTKRAAVVPLNGAWSDLGSWSAVAQMAQDELQAAPQPLHHIQLHSQRNHIRASKPVALIGVDDLVVVDTDDALLITHKANSQDVKEVMLQLAQQAPQLAKQHRKVQRPWGWYDSLELAQNHQVKHLLIKPGASISLQTHARRAEHWVIIKGEALITLGESAKTYYCYEHVYIPKHTKHRLQNNSQTDVELIEVQCGDYLGEDDIVRYEDIYGRMLESAPC